MHPQNPIPGDKSDQCDHSNKILVAPKIEGMVCPLRLWTGAIKNERIPTLKKGSVTGIKTTGIQGTPIKESSCC